MNCRRLAIAFMTLGLFSSACLASSETANDGVVDDGDASGSDDGAGTTDQADDGANDSDSADQSGDGGPDATTAPTPVTVKPRLTPGPCGVDQLPRQSIYTVANVPDDDPDGGLNVRSYDGRRIATLPEGTVVYVDECEILDDGGVWWDVVTEASISGRVNSAFLDENIPPWVPTTGGIELADAVRTLLDALATENWGEASDVLGGWGVSAQLPLVAGPDLDSQLAAYCQRVICDAPYEVVAVRGVYFHEWERPEVDVRIFYPKGEVVETFDGFNGEDSSYVSTLPGLSVLAFDPLPPVVADLAEGGSTELADDAGLFEAAEEIRAALVSESGPRIPDRYIPAEGIAVSPEAYVEPHAAERVVITAADLAAGDQLRLWGYADGSGAPIINTVDGWMASYRRELALIDPDRLSIDMRVSGSNTVDNVLDVFPDARTVEFNRQGRGGEEEGFTNWSTVLLAIEERDGQWKLVAITLDNWTI